MKKPALIKIPAQTTKNSSGVFMAEFIPNEELLRP
jgi:hypothetical protein